MANFLEQPRQFNPYIQQIPVDTYAAVGMQKQQEYNTGVQRVSAMIGALDGLEVIRDADRQYLNGQVSAITSRINEVRSKDWSSQYLVGQVGNLAGSIYNDPNIRSAVRGTQRYLRDEQDIIDAKKNGKWAPENEWHLRKQMAQWLQDPTPGASYQTDGYKPYEDVATDVLKQWKEIKPNSTLVQRPNGQFSAYETIRTPVTGADGKTLIQTETKELPPDEVAAQINALLTGSQREQLGLSALYHFRAVNDPGALGQLVDEHFTQSEKYIDDLLTSEKLNQTLQAGNSQALEASTARITALQKQKSELATNKASYKKNALANPDAVKSSIYYENWLNGISEMIGYSDVSTKIVDNPAFKAQLEELRTWAAVRRAARSGRSGSSKGKGDDEEGNVFAPNTGQVLPISEEQREGVNLNDFWQKLEEVNDAGDQAMYGLLYRHFGERFVTHTVKDLNGDGVAEEFYTLKPGKEKEAALTTGAWWKQYRMGDPNLDITIRETLADTDEKVMLANRLGKVSLGIKDKADQYVKGLPTYEKAQQAIKDFESLPSTVIGGVDISPSDVKNYFQLRSENLKTAGSAGVGASGYVYLPNLTDSQLGHYNLTRKKFNALQAADNGKGSSSDDRNLSNLMEGLGPSNKLTKEMDEAKEKFIADEVKKYKGIFNQVVLNVDSHNAETMRPVANFVQALAATAKQTGMGGATNWSNVREMIGEKHAAETVYGYVQDREGNVRIRISNVDVDKGRPQEIAVDARTAQINNLYTHDPLATTRSMLDLGENMRTGSSFEESIPLRNGQTGRYTVRHEVENYGGRYKVKLYVTDNQTPGASTRQVPINTVLFNDWNKLTSFLMNDVSEKFIDSMLSSSSSSVAP